MKPLRSIINVFFCSPFAFRLLRPLGAPLLDVLAIEEAVIHFPPQPFGFFDTQLLAGISVSNPPRENPTHPSLPLACYLTFPPRLSATPPRFLCWITRRISPNMAVISFKCSSTPWACSHAKGIHEGTYHFGFSPANFLQLAFPSTDDFPTRSSPTSLGYLFSTRSKARLLRNAVALLPLSKPDLSHLSPARRPYSGPSSSASPCWPHIPSCGGRLRFCFCKISYPPPFLPLPLRRPPPLRY